MIAKTIQTDSQLPYGAVTEQRFRLIFKQLKNEPEGVLRKDLLEMCEIPGGAGSKLIRRILDAGLVRVEELPKGGRYRGRAPHLIIPTEKLLGRTIDEAVEEVVKTPRRQYGRGGSASPSTEAPTETPTKPLQKVVVTRHNALVAYMKELGLVDETTPVYPHVRGSMIAGKHVFGALPLHLMALAAKVTVVPLRNVPHNLRGQDLSIEEVRMYAAPPVTYEVREVLTEF